MIKFRWLILPALCSVALGDPAGQDSPELITLRAAYRTQVETVTQTVDIRFPFDMRHLSS